MARKDRILAYIATSEYFRQLARNKARDIFDSIDPMSILGDPAGSAAYLTDEIVSAMLTIISSAAIRANTYAVELGYERIPSPVQDLILSEVLQEIHAESEQMMHDQIATASTRIDDMITAGVSDETVRRNLTSPGAKAALFVGLLAAMRQAASGYVVTVERRVVDAALAVSDSGAGAPKTFRWQTVGDKNVCQDALENSCEPRNGMEQSLADWKQIGTPGAPNLLCTIYSRGGLSNCRCNLGDANEPADEPGPIDATEAIAAGKARADANPR